MPSVLRAARVRHKYTRRCSHRIGRPRFRTLSGPTELAHNPARFNARLSSELDFLCVSVPSLQPVSIPVLSVSFPSSRVQPWCEAQPLARRIKPSRRLLQRSGSKRAARGRRHANTPSTRGQALAVEAKARRTPRREPKHSSSGTETPSPRPHALTVASPRRSVTGLNTFGSARRDQTATPTEFEG